MYSSKDLIDRFKHYEGQRYYWDTHYQDLADYMLPRKADIVRQRSKGEKRMELILMAQHYKLLIYPIFFTWYAHKRCISLVSLTLKDEGRRDEGAALARRYKPAHDEELLTYQTLKLKYMRCMLISLCLARLYVCGDGRREFAL